VVVETVSGGSGAVGAVEEKKESRKLNSLFKTDSPPRPPNHYLSDLPSIDSIEMANSVSVKDSFKV
jgi:hypothetical protein